MEVIKVKIGILMIISVLFVIGLVAFVHGDGAQLSVDVQGSGPLVESVVIEDASPTAGGTTQITITARVVDTNGRDDIDVVNMSFTVGNPANGKIINTNMRSSCDNLDPDLDRIECIATYNMQFYDPAMAYTVRVYAEDGSSASDTETDTFTYLELVSLELDVDTVAFGSMAIGATSTIDGDENWETGTATLKNQGNAVIDAQVFSTDFSGSTDSFGADQAESQFGTLGFGALAVDPGRTETGLNLNFGASSLENLDFKLTIPSGALPESYSSTVSVVAVANS